MTWTYSCAQWRDMSSEGLSSSDGKGKFVPPPRCQSWEMSSCTSIHPNIICLNKNALKNDQIYLLFASGSQYIITESSEGPEGSILPHLSVSPLFRKCGQALRLISEMKQLLPWLWSRLKNRGKIVIRTQQSPEGRFHPCLSIYLFCVICQSICLLIHGSLWDEQKMKQWRTAM